jgi:hypothetical protein
MDWSLTLAGVGGRKTNKTNSGQQGREEKKRNARQS